LQKNKKTSYSSERYGCFPKLSLKCVLFNASNCLPSSSSSLLFFYALDLPLCCTYASGHTCSASLSQPRAILSTYEHPTEQGDQQRKEAAKARNDEEGNSEGSTRNGVKKSYLASGGVLGDFTETLRANDDDSSSSRSGSINGRVR